MPDMATATSRAQKARMPISATEIRDLRNRVRHTVNILALDGMRVDEMPGEAWCAEMEERRIRWTPTFPLPPHDYLDNQAILYLCAHEISHVNYSGLIDWELLAKKHATAKNIDDHTKTRFHRFVNAVEDIRVDRLSAREYAGFRGPKVHLDMQVREWHLANGEPEGWSLIDACALNWIYSKDLELPPFGSADAKAIVNETWPFIDRVANLESTMALADAIWPLFVKLAEIDTRKPSTQGPDPQTGPTGTPSGSSQGESPQDRAKEAADATDPNAGASQPTQEPAKSDGDKDTAPLAKGEEFEGMAEDAKTRKAQQALEEAAADVQRDRHQARRVRDMVAHSSSRGKMRRRGSGEAEWNATADLVRAASNSLANRLKAVLQQNAADNYTGGHRRGRLHTSKAYRASAGNPRIFRKREAMGALDYAFGILVDVSGSMNEGMGHKKRGAFNAAVLVAEALSKAKLDLMMLTWESAPCSLKRFRDTLQAVKPTIGADLARPGGGTYEAPALIAAIEEFRSNPSKHRMLFTITDGETTLSHESKALLQELRDIGVISVAIGIGFRPASYYDITLRVNDAAELAQILPQFINSYVRKGAR